MDAARGGIEIAQHSQQPSVAIRNVFPMGELDIGAVFDEYATRLVTYLEQNDVQPVGAPYARYREFGPDRADVEIGFPVDADLGDVSDLDANGVIGSSELPGGAVARLLHSGPYDGLAQTYQQIEAYLSDTGVAPSGAPWESYLVMPDAAGGDPQLLQTEVNWPIG